MKAGTGGSKQKIANSSQIESNPYLPTIDPKRNGSGQRGEDNYGKHNGIASQHNMSPYSAMIVGKEPLEKTGLRLIEAAGTDQPARPQKQVPSLDQSENDNDSPERPERPDCDWREYFTEEEIVTAYQQMNQGIDPNDAEDDNQESVGSDSDPSEDNLEKDEMQDFLESLPISVGHCSK